MIKIILLNLGIFRILADKKILDIISSTKTKENRIKKIFLNASVFAYASEIDLKRKNILKKCDNINILTLPDFIKKNNTTHFIIGENERLSFNYLVAILKGVFIVQENCRKLPDNNFQKLLSLL